MKKLDCSKVNRVMIDRSVPCYIFEKKIVKPFEYGPNVTIVVNARGHRYEAGTKHLKKVTPCEHERKIVPGICFRKKEVAEKCTNRFCLNYQQAELI